MHISAPIVSVIIPTCGRPRYLPIAVQSALEGMGSDVEVIVVPNGRDQSWRESLASFLADDRVRVEPIDAPSGNAARNHGLALARGEFVRFLDDDDFLYPAAAVRQYREIHAKNADIASGAAHFVDEREQVFDSCNQPETQDFCEATLSPNRKCFIHLHVYRRKMLDNARWNLDTRVRQDVEWQLDLCAQREWRWVKTEEYVGAWRHHWASRVSQSTEFNAIRASTVSMILSTYERLVDADRLTPTRRRATAFALWTLVHKSFFLAPLYWTRVAAQATAIDAMARPTARMFHWEVTRKLQPIVLEWIVLPKRWLQHQYSLLLRRLQLRHFW